MGSAHCIYSVAGGDPPQALVNEVAEAIHAGDAKAVLLAGSEATAAMKLALKARHSLDWSDHRDGARQDRGLGDALLSEYALSNGLDTTILAR